MKMDLERIGSRHRGNNNNSFVVESETFDLIAKEAEARSAVRRQARYEARNIRMKELEKKQKEEESIQNHNIIPPSQSNSNHNTSVYPGESSNSSSWTRFVNPVQVGRSLVNFLLGSERSVDRDRNNEISSAEQRQRPPGHPASAHSTPIPVRKKKLRDPTKSSSENSSVLESAEKKEEVTKNDITKKGQKKSYVLSSENVEKSRGKSNNSNCEKKRCFEENNNKKGREDSKCHSNFDKGLSCEKDEKTENPVHLESLPNNKSRKYKTKAIKVNETDFNQKPKEIRIQSNKIVAPVISEEGSIINEKDNVTPINNETFLESSIKSVCKTNVLLERGECSPNDCVEHSFYGKRQAGHTFDNCPSPDECISVLDNVSEHNKGTINLDKHIKIPPPPPMPPPGYLLPDKNKIDKKPIKRTPAELALIEKLSALDDEAFAGFVTSKLKSRSLKDEKTTMDDGKAKASGDVGNTQEKVEGGNNGYESCTDSKGVRDGGASAIENATEIPPSLPPSPPPRPPETFHSVINTSTNARECASNYSSGEQQKTDIGTNIEKMKLTPSAEEEATASKVLAKSDSGYSEAPPAEESGDEELFSAKKIGKSQGFTIEEAHECFEKKIGSLKLPNTGEDEESEFDDDEGSEDNVRLREDRRTPRNYSSRRSSTDSSEDGYNLNIRDLKIELKETEEKFRKAMVANAGLDNEKSALTYQVDLFKDRLEESEEITALINKELREKNREYELLKRSHAEAQRAVQLLQAQLDEQSRLLTERGLVLVGNEEEEESVAVSDDEQEKRTRGIVSADTANILSGLGSGPLDVRIKRLADERDDLQDAVRRLKLDLEEERSKNQRLERSPFTPEEVERETKRIIDDYKFKFQKSEQDSATLQTNVARLETQVIRYKTAAETAERSEHELKTERRKLQRELRDSQSRVDELETSNKHLEARLAKLKTAKSNLLKDL